MIIPYLQYVFRPGRTIIAFISLCCVLADSDNMVYYTVLTYSIVNFIARSISFFIDQHLADKRLKNEKDGESNTQGTEDST